MCGDDVQPRIEDVENEPPVVGEMLANALQGLPLVLRRQQVQKRAERDHDKVEAPTEREPAHVALDEFDAALSIGIQRGNFLLRDGEHQLREVEAHDREARLGHRDQDTPGAAAQLQHRRPGFPRLGDVERHIAFEAGGAVIVISRVGSRVVAHAELSSFAV